MRERRNLISARCIKKKYFRWILNFCPLNFSKFHFRKNGYFFYYSYSTKAKRSKLQRPNRRTVPSSSVLSSKKAKSFTSLCCRHFFGNIMCSWVVVVGKKNKIKLKNWNFLKPLHGDVS